MPWVISLHVTACAGGANLAGAFITDGQSTFSTDSYGDATAVVYDDVDPAYGVNIGKSGFTTRYTVLYQSQAGTTLQVCLTPRRRRPGAAAPSVASSCPPRRAPRTLPRTCGLTCSATESCDPRTSVRLSSTRSTATITASARRSPMN